MNAICASIMGAAGRRHNTAGTVVNLAANQTAVVEGRRGTRIRCVHGQLWLTQEGDRRDYFLPRGVSFVAGIAGKIVIHGVTQRNCATVGLTQLPRTCISARNTLQYATAFFSDIEVAARRARNAHVAALLASAAHTVRQAWQRLARRFQTMSRGNP